MHITKKKVVVVSMIVSLMAIMSFGTLAWFNATYKVTNTFKVATSDDQGTPDFSVTVTESAPPAMDGALPNDMGGYDYQDILPGDVLAKRPVVKNTGKYDQWVRVHVTFDEFSKIEAACKRCGISSDLRTWLDIQPGWTADNDATVVNGDTVTYVYYYDNKLTTNVETTLFTEVTIPSEFEQQDMTYVSGDFSITVKADVLQADNTGDNAKGAFAACWK